MHDLTPVYEGLASLRKCIDKMEADLKEASKTDNYLLMAKAFVTGNIRFSIAEERCESSGQMVASLLDNKQREEFALWLLALLAQIEEDVKEETPQDQKQPETNSVPS